MLKGWGVCRDYTPTPVLRDDLLGTRLPLPLLAPTAARRAHYAASSQQNQRLRAPELPTTDKDPNMPRARFIRGPYDGEIRNVDPDTNRLEIFGERDEPRLERVLLGVYVAVRDPGQRDAVADMFWQPQRPEVGELLRVTAPPP